MWTYQKIKSRPNLLGKLHKGHSHECPYLQPAWLSRRAYMRPMSPIPIMPTAAFSMVVAWWQQYAKFETRRRSEPAALALVDALITSVTTKDLSP